MSEVFADSFYFIALLNPRDRAHQVEVRASHGRSDRLVMTHWVLMEVADALCATAIRQQSAGFLRAIGAPSSEAVVISELAPWFEQGLEIYENRLDKAWSLTDCIRCRVKTT